MLIYFILIIIILSNFNLYIITGASGWEKLMYLHYLNYACIYLFV